MQNQKFHLSPKAIAWESSVSLLAVPFLGVALCIGAVAVGAIGNSEIGLMQYVLPIIFGMPALAIVIISIVLVLISIGRAIFSYLLLTSNGLEYRLWPLHKIRCTWDDVEQIRKSTLPFQGDILALKKGEVSGFHILLDFNKGNLGVSKTLPVIPLYKIDGWSNGKLESELRKYAPRLFIERSTS